MNVLVMGAGGVGGYFGALLARAGHPLTVIARGPHLDAIRAGGLRVESAIEPPFTVPADADSSPPAGARPDLILFTVKSYDIAEAIERIRPAVGPGTVILTLLNGVISGDALAAAFGRDCVLDGVVYIESYVKAPGVIAQDGGPRKATFGRRDGNGEREQALLAAFESAGWNVELAGDILVPLWQKLTFIGPFAAVNTVTGLPGQQLASSEECVKLTHTMMREYAAVARAEGADLPPDAPEAALERFRGFPGLSSMLRDRIAGKRLESDALVADVARRGRARGIPTPATDALNALLAPMASGKAGQVV